MELEPRKYKTSELFLVFFAVWCIDFFTTIMALNLKIFEGKFYEVNPISNWFFSLGLFGWVLAFMFSFVMLFIFSWGIIRLINKLKSEDLKFSLWIGVIVLFILFEGNVIFNNINLMMGISI